MYILSFDTSIGTCSVALFKEGLMTQYRIEEERHQQAERLLPFIESILAEEHISYKDIDYIALTIGPGSFTGIRIGLATATALSMAISKPIIPVTCFEAMVVNEIGQVCAVLDAGRNALYTQKFTNGLATTKPTLIDIDTLLKFADGAKTIGNKSVDEVILPNANLAGLSAIREIAKNNINNNKVSPLYIRNF